MFTITITNSQAEEPKTVTIYTLNRQKMEQIADILYPPGVTYDEKGRITLNHVIQRYEEKKDETQS
jgi:hypothetical protein